MIEKYIQALKKYALSHDPSCADGESILGLLYECLNENCPYDNDEIKSDFNELYRQMNGMTIRDMDKVIYPFVSSAGITKRLASLKVSRLVFI